MAVFDNLLRRFRRRPDGDPEPGATGSYEPEPYHDDTTETPLQPGPAANDADVSRLVADVPPPPLSDAPEPARAFTIARAELDAPLLIEPTPAFASVGSGSPSSVAEPSAPFAATATTAPSHFMDDDVLHDDHLFLTCPYCGLEQQRIGARCTKCNLVIVRLPRWAQRRHRGWITRRLSWRRLFIACAVVLIILFVVWINYPFAPDPVVLFKKIHSTMTIDMSAGSWAAAGRDLRHSRFVELGPPPPVGDIAWTSFVPNPLSAEPVVQSPNVYVATADGVYPLAQDTGELREGWEGDTLGRITSAPAVIDSYLFFGSTDHTVNAWNAVNSDPIWSFQAADTVQVAPIVSDGLVYISSGKGALYALDAANQGAQIWRKQLDSNASAAVAIHDGKLFVGDDQGIFYILSARTGQERFRYRTPRTVAGSPVVSLDGSRAYFVSGGQLYAVDATLTEIPGQYQFKQVWAQLWLWQVPGVPRPPGQQGGLWRFTPENPLLGVSNSPALADDDIYVGALNHRLYALNALDGSLNWEFEAADAIWGSPLVVKDQVIFGDDSGTVYSLNRTDGTETWSLSVDPDPSDDDRYRIRISPALSNGLLVVRTDSGHVFGIR